MVCIDWWIRFPFCLAVGAATALTLLLAIWFILGMIRGLTEPLNEAVRLADRVAAGEHPDPASRTSRCDAGNLLD